MSLIIIFTDNYFCMDLLDSVLFKPFISFLNSKLKIIKNDYLNSKINIMRNDEENEILRVSFDFALMVIEYCEVLEANKKC